MSSNDFSWTSQLSVSKKIALGFLTVLLLHISIVVISHVQLRHAEQDLRAYDHYVRQVKRIGAIDRDVGELELQLQLFARDGIHSTRTRIEELFEGIESKIRDAQKDAVIEHDRERLESMMGHLVSQRENFNALVVDRERRRELVSSQMFQLQRELEQKLQDLEDVAEANELKASVQKAIGEIFHYVTDPDAQHVRESQGEFRRVFDLLDRMETQLPNDASPLAFVEIRETINRIENMLFQIVQSTRSYLHLVNVVIAGEGFEFHHISNNMGEEHMARIGRLSESMLNERKAVQYASLVFSLLTVVLGILAASAISRSVAPPLREITQTLDKLSRGEATGEIPNTNRGDELGLLARAATVFRSKSEQTERLLELANSSELKLRKLNQELERQTILANRMVEEANQATQAKSDFLANMSHEIRTPMTAILGFSETLSDCVDHPEALNAVQTIQRNGEHLLSIINDILDLSKVESGKMRLERMDINVSEMLQELTSLARVKMEDRDLDFRVNYVNQIPSHINTDPTRLRQILINLIGNAIKFTEHGEIAVHVAMVENENEPFLQFDVSDTGIGIDPTQAGELFKPFNQADTSVTRRFGGTGLGLTISKHFAELLGGKLELVDSKVGVGSRFRVTIAVGDIENVELQAGPACALRSEQGEAKPVHVNSLKGLRILLAEDGPDNQKLIAFLLKKEGADVTVVDDGQKAVEAIRNASADSERFDCILMDMQMPVMDGFEATRALRAQDYNGPILALTAHAMESVRKNCLECGCDEYLSKPINRKAMIEMVNKFARSANAAGAKAPESLMPSDR